MDLADRPGRTPLIHETLAKAARLARKRASLGRRIARESSRLERDRNRRLILAALTVLGLLAAALKPGWNLAPIALVAFLPPFFIFVTRTRRRTHHLERLTRWAAFLDRQERRLRGLPVPERGSVRAPDRKEDFIANDLGLFGESSLWSQLDETITPGGRRELLSAILTNPPSPDAILGRQATLRSLRPERWFFTKLTLERESSDDFALSENEARSILMEPFTPKWFPLALIAVALAWIASVVVAFHPEWPRAGALTYAIFVVSNFLLIAQAKSVFERGMGLSHHLSQLASIFALMERRAKLSSRVRELCPMTSLAGPAREAKRVDRVLVIVGVKTNPLLHIVLNALMPWSNVGAWLLERRRMRIHESLPICMSELAHLEFLGSLVIFDRYQTDHYPRVDAERLGFSGLFHPLVPRESVIANDFSFAEGSRLGLLTGSNMSGKSTFLRAVGLNQILANMGAPVFAESLGTKPMAVETCIEVSDSLRDGVSYFYAEVRRLKKLIDRAERGDGVLFLIDEIFRGTNNRERHIGSEAVVRALARTKGAQGFVSTHDLELTTLADRESALKNLHFRETIENGRMFFSYRLNPGPSPTTNALRIMEMEGLPVEVSPRLT